MEVTEKKRKTLTKDEMIQELMELLKQNQMPKQSNDVYELAAYIDNLEQKLDTMTEEMTKVQEQLKVMQEDTLANNLKKSLSDMVTGMENRCAQMKQTLFEVKETIKIKAIEIVTEYKNKGKAVLNRVSEFLGVKKKLEHIRENVRESVKTTEAAIGKIDAFGKGIREANQQLANTFRTFADKPEVDYSEKEKKFSKTELLKQPWQAKKKIFASMELHLDAAIDKVSNLAMDVELAKADKEQEHTEKEHTQIREEHMEQNIEHMEGEIVAVPAVLVAEPACEYGSEVFERMMEQAEKRHHRGNGASKISDSNVVQEKVAERAR